MRRKSSRREDNHMDDHGDGVKVRTRLELEPNVSVMKMCKEQDKCARSVEQCYAIGEVRCGIVVSVVISICVIELSVLVLLVVILQFISLVSRSHFSRIFLLYLRYSIYIISPFSCSRLSRPQNLIFIQHASKCRGLKTYS